MNIDKYDYFIFDSDGVIFNSNNIKIDSFCNIAKSLLKVDFKESINKFITENSRSTREDVIRFIIKTAEEKSLIKKESKGKSKLFDKLLGEFKNQIYSEMLLCEKSNLLSKFKIISKNKNWIVLTLGNETDTKNFYIKRNLYKYFDMGIYGGPKPKQENIEFLKKKLNLKHKKVLFFGDSYKDAYLAKTNKFDFIYISKWSCCSKVKEFCNKNKFEEYETLDLFISSLF